MTKLEWLVWKMTNAFQRIMQTRQIINGVFSMYEVLFSEEYGKNLSREIK